MRRNKRKKRAVRLGGLVLLTVVLAGFMMLFQVRTVNVYGNSRHAAEEISDGLLDGFLMKKYTVSSVEIPERNDSGYTAVSGFHQGTDEISV